MEVEPEAMERCTQRIRACIGSIEGVIRGPQDQSGETCGAEEINRLGPLGGRPARDVVVGGNVVGRINVEAQRAYIRSTNANQPYLEVDFSNTTTFMIRAFSGTSTAPAGQFSLPRAACTSRAVGEEENRSIQIMGQSITGVPSSRECGGIEAQIAPMSQRPILRINGIEAN